MPTIIPTELIYDEEFPRTTRGFSLRAWKAIAPDTITEMYLWVESITGGGTWIFTVRKNGVSLFSTSDMFQMTSSVLDVSKTGLSIPVAIGDAMSIDFVGRIGGGSFSSLTSPVIFLMRTQES